MDSSAALPSWQYDEKAKAGVDYNDAAVAAEYDKQHGKFRDFEKDARAVIQLLDLKPEQTVIDLGCGTGAFVITAARSCRTVYAVDISRAMLDRCAEKAREAGLSNIETHCAGFLSYEHKGAPADAIVTVAALHHLPDFWKAVAFKRMYDMLKPGGKLYLFDIIFAFPVESYRGEFDDWVNGMRERAGDSMAEESIVHIRDEYSTFDWVIDGMLERTGFRIGQKFSSFPRSLTYICIK